MTNDRSDEIRGMDFYVFRPNTDKLLRLHGTFAEANDLRDEMLDEIERLQGLEALLGQIAYARRGDSGGQELTELHLLPEEIERMWSDSRTNADEIERLRKLVAEGHSIERVYRAGVRWRFNCQCGEEPFIPSTRAPRSPSDEELLAALDAHITEVLDGGT